MVRRGWAPDVLLGKLGVNVGAGSIDVDPAKETI